MMNTIQKSLLSEIINCIPCNNQIEPKIQLLLRELYAITQDNSNNLSESLLLSIIIKTLLKRFQSDIPLENIYESTSQTPQIELFNILIDKFPFVKFSQELINHAIINQMTEHEKITLIDIGIGQGTQVLNILSKINNPANLKKINIIGIEPFKEALDLCSNRIKDYHSMGIVEITFTPILEYVEQLNFDRLSTLIDGPLIINASLALHHIQKTSDRINTLQQLKRLNPIAFYLIEPNVDHMTPDLKIRIENCYNHFIALFQVIDNLNIKDEDKKALKIFFSREIEDILGKQEEKRFEKHNKAIQWVNLLNESGFINHSKNLSLPIQESYGVQMKYHNEGFFGFTYLSETVLAVFHVS